jgi:hypothetical protein
MVKGLSSKIKIYKDPVSLKSFYKNSFLFDTQLICFIKRINLDKD